MSAGAQVFDEPQALEALAHKEFKVEDWGDKQVRLLLKDSIDGNKDIETQ